MDTGSHLNPLVSFPGLLFCALHGGITFKLRIEVLQRVLKINFILDFYVCFKPVKIPEWATFLLYS